MSSVAELLHEIDTTLVDNETVRELGFTAVLEEVDMILEEIIDEGWVHILPTAMDPYDQQIGTLNQQTLPLSAQATGTPFVARAWQRSLL